MFVLQRLDDLYVARPGSEHSYTKRLEEAMIFATRRAAESARCVDNERVVDVADAISRAGGSAR